MSKKLFLTVTAALFIFAASCGRTAKEQNNPSQQTETMNDEAFSQVVQDIFLKLPKEVMPDYAYETPEMHQPTGEENDAFNCRKLGDEWEGEEFYARWSWEMAAYPTDDQQNAVVIITFKDCTQNPDCEATVHEFNYHIQTGKFIEIEIDKDPFYLMAAFDENHPEIDKITDFVKGLFYALDYNSYVDTEYHKNGYSVFVNFSEYWYEVKDFYDNNAAMAESMQAKTFNYQWNGKRFELVSIVNPWI